MKYLTNQISKNYKKLLLFVLILVFLINLPFISQAFHIDDGLNIYLARQILKNPANPYNFNIVYRNILQKFYRFYANPPLNGYLLSLMIQAFGENEVYLHLCYTIYTIFIGIFMFLISKKFLLTNEEATISTSLLLLSPAFIVISHTIMPDIPLLCFYLASFYLFLEAQEKNKVYLYVGSGIFAAMACLTRYSGLTLIPFFLFYVFLKGVKRNLHYVLTLLIPLAALFFWYQWAQKLYSSSYWSNIISFETHQTKIGKISMQFIANITYLGGASFFPLSMLYILKRANKKSNIFSIIIAGVISTISAVILYKDYGHTFTQLILFFIFSFCCILFLIKILTYFKSYLIEKSSNALLIVWIFSLIGFNSLFAHASVKYNILILPAFIIIFIILLRETSSNNNRFAILISTIILTTLLGFSVATADMMLANTYRAFAERCFRTYKTKNNKLYYTGHWGWKYYMEKWGAKPILPYEDNFISQDDIIITPSIAWPQPLPYNLKSESLEVEAVTITTRFPIRTMNGWAKAFFHSSQNFPFYKGVLPFSFSKTVPLEIFYIIKIKNN